MRDRPSDHTIGLIVREQQERMIREYILTHELTRVAPAGYLAVLGIAGPQFSRSKRAGWCKGRAHSPRWRNNLALSYARHHELSEPAWTDLKEAQLLAFRAEGKSYRQIARLMGKTKAAIQARVRYLSLGRRLHP